MSASDIHKAARHWLDASHALLPSTRNNPLRAASQNNAGAAYVLLRQTLDAEAALADAERCWMQLLGAIATADIPISGRSSAFHFSLASQNIDAFQNAHRRRYSRLCEAGLAITRFNRLLASAEPSASAAVVPALASQLADLLGPQSPEVRLLLATPALSPETGAADSHYADKIAAFASRRAPMPSPDDWQRLEVAVALTALLPPGLDIKGGAPVDVCPVKSSSTR
jgi:hypothetical protein